MNRKLIIFVTSIFFCEFAIADCGSTPSQPSLLTEPQITASQLEELEGQFEAYLASIDFFQACVDGQANAVDVEIDNYESIYQDWMLLRESAEEQKILGIERYNSQIENVQSDEVVPEDEAQQ